MSSVAEALRKIADEVEADPSRWTKSVLARDADGSPTLSTHPSAVCWCASGFLSRDLGTRHGSDWPARDALRRATEGNLLIGGHNDHLESYKDFVAWFRRAADMEEERES